MTALLRSSQLEDAPFSGDIDDRSILHAVLSFCPRHHRILSGTRCVSKAWRSLLEDPLGATPFHTADAFISRDGTKLKVNTMLFPVVSSSGHEQQSSGDATSSSTSRPAAHGFAVQCISPIGRKFRHECAIALSRHYSTVMPLLSMLDLAYAEVDVSVFDVLKDIHTLKSLRLVNCRRMTSISPAINKVSSLTDLEVTHCPLTSNGLHNLHLPNLRTLIVTSCQDVDSFEGASPATSSGLRRVSVTLCPLNDDGCADLLAHASRIEDVDLESTAVEAVPHLLSEEGLASLQKLSLSYTGIGSDVLEDALSYTSHLTYLALDGCPNILNLRFLRSISPTARTKLGSLDLSNTESLVSLDDLSHLKNLTGLRISSSSLADNMLWIAGMHALVALDLSGSSVNDSGIRNVANACPSTLRYLFLTGCGSVTSVNALAACARLERLLCSSTSLKTEGISALASCDELLEIDLSHTEVSNVNHLLRCRKLKSVNVFGASMGDSTGGFDHLVASGRIEVISELLYGGVRQ